MRLAIILNGEYEHLAKAEAEAILRCEIKKEGVLGIAETKKKPRICQAAYIKLVAEIVSDDIRSKGRFSLTVKRLDGNAPPRDSLLMHYASQIEGKVDLKNPDEEFIVFASKGRSFLSRVIWKNSEKFEKRRPHLREGFAPVSLSPRLARSMVNLARAEKGSTIYDPMCGTGGILIEAKEAGFNIKGSDISSDMVSLTKKNLDDTDIEKKDFFEITENIEYAVFDPPYGKATSLRIPLEELSGKIFSHLGKILIKRAVLSFPSGINIEKSIRESGLILEGRYQVPIHKSLSKQIIIVSPDKNLP